MSESQANQPPVKPAEKPKLIIDTNAFIKCLDLNKLSQSYDIYTSDMALYEIKDKKAKEKFSHLLFEVKTKYPSKTASSFVKNFSQKTGDFVSLSETDLEIIAIGYTFAEESGKVGSLRKNPPEPRTYHPPAKEEQISNQIKENQNENNNEDDWKNDLESPQKNAEEPKEEEENIRKEEPTGEKATENTEDRTISKEIPQNINENTSTEDQHHDENVNLKEETQNEKKESSNVGSPLKNEQKKEEEEESDSDDGEGWINPDNISQHFFTSQKVAESENALGIAIMTSDFAMQNVILQIGIPLLSVDGLTIKQTKKWILECYSCYNLCKTMNREFCPSCGNHTLSKLSCSLNADGTYYIYRKANYKHKTRGLIYPIPKPQGGRNNNDLLLREDEFILKKKNYLGNQNKDKKREKAQFDKAQRDFENGLGFDIIRQEKYKSKKMEFGYGKHNPNERRTGKKH